MSAESVNVGFSKINREVKADEVVAASVVGRVARPVLDLVAAGAVGHTITAADHGSVINLDGTVAGVITVTLPAASAALRGVEFDVVLADDTGASDHVITATTAANMVGFVADASAAVANVPILAANNTITFDVSAALVGDSVHCFCTGAFWVCRGYSAVTLGLLVSTV